MNFSFQDLCFAVIAGVLVVALFVGWGGF